MIPWPLNLYRMGKNSNLRKSDTRIRLSEFKLVHKKTSVSIGDELLEGGISVHDGKLRGDVLRLIFLNSQALLFNVINITHEERRLKIPEQGK